MAMTTARRMRQILRSEKYRDGLTIYVLARMISSTPKATGLSLRRMPDAYVDRWVLNRKGPGPGRRYAAIWCVVVPPEDCPYPSKD